MAVVIPFLTMFDDSGIKKAKKSMGGFESSIKSVGKVVAGALSVAGIMEAGRFLLDASKAADADSKSQMLLAESLKRSAGATKKQVSESEAFIQSLSKQVGIVDDNLRPALASMARVTGNARKAQHLLKIALNASALSGKPLATVQGAVAKAYVGNTTALKKMFPELTKVENKFVAMHGSAKTLADKTQLAAMMLGALDKESQGLAAAKADPFAKFNVALDNLKEKIGGLVLPKVTAFLDDIMKPGGAVDQLGQFIDQMGNPKTDTGKAFQEIQTSAADAFKAVDALFGLFDPNGKRASGMMGLLQVIDVILQELTFIMDTLSGKPFMKTTMEVAQSMQQAGATALWAMGGKKGPAPAPIPLPKDIATYESRAYGLKDQTKKAPTYVNITQNITTNNPTEVTKAIAKALRNGTSLRSLLNQY